MLLPPALPLSDARQVKQEKTAQLYDVARDLGGIFRRLLAVQDQSGDEKGYKASTVGMPEYARYFVNLIGRGWMIVDELLAEFFDDRQLITLSNVLFFFLNEIEQSSADLDLEGVPTQNRRIENFLEELRILKPFFAVLDDTLQKERGRRFTALLDQPSDEWILFDELVLGERCGDGLGFVCREEFGRRQKAQKNHKHSDAP